MTQQHDRVALVTGGAQGIGKGIARRLLEDGYAVIIADVDAEAGEETVAEYGGLGSIAFVATDVADESSARRCLEHVRDRYGRLDALVNNAGLPNATNAPLEQLSLDHWNRVLAVNLTGPMLMAKYAAPLLRESRGAIVNIASVRALQSEPHGEAYAASKGGVIALTHALAMSLAPAVRVNSVSPGWIDVSEWKQRRERHESELRPIDHAQHPAGRVGRPEDIAAIVAFLLSDAAGFITAENFVVDGGMLRRMMYAP
jgi:NAD(P)-dependent dehydrogenase (short-subunit alcohol dehydrogenase family)